MLPTKRSIEGVKMVMLVASGKGGVGKSTVSANLAISLARTGIRTGLLDADLYGPSQPRLMGLLGRKVQADENKFLIPLEAQGVRCMSIGLLIGDEAPVVWRGLMVMKAIQQLLFQVRWSPLDVLVVDMPPGTGDTQLTISQQVVVDGAIIVSSPQELSLMDARRAVGMFGKVSIPILGYVENMSGFVCPCCGKRTQLFPHGSGLQGVEKLAEIPLNPALAQASDTGSPLKEDEQFVDLARKLKNKLGL